MNTKKTVRLAGIIIIVFVIVSLVVPFLVPSSLYKNILIKQIESGINGRVSFADVKIKIFPLPGFTLREVSVLSKDGAFGGKDVVKAGGISADVLITPLFSKRLSVSVKLDKPQIFYRVLKSGETNFDNLLSQKKTASDKRNSRINLINKAFAETKGKTGQGKPPDWELDVRGLSIKDGRLEYIKEGSEPLVINKFNFSVNDFSSDGNKPTPVSLSAAILKSEKENFNLKGKILFDTKKELAKIEDLVISLDNTKMTTSGEASLKGGMPVTAKIKIAPIDIAGLKSYFPSLGVIGEIKEPKISLDMEGPVKNPEALNISGSISSPYIRYQEYEISSFKAAVKYMKGVAEMSSLSGVLYEGALKGSGRLSLKGEPSYDIDVAIADIDVAKIPPIKGQIKGRGSFNVKAAGQGTDAIDIKRNLKADGSIHLSDGDIPSLKLGEKIFGNRAWNILAGTGIILSPSGLAELRSLDASCKNFDMTFNMANSVINTPAVKWQNPKYTVNLSGSVTMDEKLLYKGNFSLLKAPTDRLVINQQAKNILTNRAGELSVPFDIDGTVSNPNVSPDEKYLASLFTKTVNELVVKKAVDAVEQKIAPKVEEAGKNLIKGIFGN